MDEINVGKSALPVHDPSSAFIPVTRVENFCASGTESFRERSTPWPPELRPLLAMGVEKLKDTGYGGLPNPGSNWGP